MIQGWIQWPMTWRCVVVALVGVLIGTQINRAIYRWAWYARWIGPWSPPHPHASPQKWQDKIPIVGWWFLRRDAPLHGAGFWIRPMFIEFGFGAALVFLYQWLSDGGILPSISHPKG